MKVTKKKLLKYTTVIAAFIFGFCLAFYSWWTFFTYYDFKDNLDYAYSQENIH